DPQTGDPIATLQVTSGQIASMTIRCYPMQLPQNLARMLYVQRYWQISHTGTGWTADVTFPYTDQEAAMILDRLQLRGVRQPTTLSAWEDPIMGTTSVSDVMTSTVKVSNLNPTNIVGNIALAQPYMMVGKDGGTVIPTLFSLEQNYPNPFNPSTRIVFDVAEERSVRIAVYNSLGAEVAELVNEVLPAGRYEVAFDASALPSGTYLYRMLAGEFVATQRMTLSK
ncbi:MAG: T9SS type A sorting domain-containing protein, partial [Bacteroidota bacterium]